MTASPNEHGDLSGPSGGGGGNFGVVTSFLFQAHPVDAVHAGPIFWSMDQAPEVMRWYRRFITEAPEELYGFLALIAVPPAPPFPEELRLNTVCGIFWCYTGDPGKADEVFAPIRAVAPPLLDLVGRMPFTALQSMFDPLLPPGLQWYWKGDFVGELPDEAIAVHLDFMARAPTPLSQIHFYPINGAVHRVAADATAFGFRDATWSTIVLGVRQIRRTRISSATGPWPTGTPSVPSPSRPAT